MLQLFATSLANLGSSKQYVETMDVTFIGSGNLAWHLAPALDNSDYPVREVYSVNPRNAEALVKRLYRASVSSSLDFSASGSRLFILAVPDDAIAEVAREIVLPEDAILVHTSGSQPLGILKGAATSRLGVFYPFQTFTKGRKLDFRDVHMFVEGNSSEVTKVLLDAARSITGKVTSLSSDERRFVHIGAIFASNFTNHMLTISRDIMSRRKLDFEWLKPLVIETINKSMSIGSEAAQTGPARRGDLEILDKHMELLREDEAVAEIYRVVSQHIVDWYHPDR